MNKSIILTKHNRVPPGLFDFFRDEIEKRNAPCDKKRISLRKKRKKKNK